MTVIATGFDRKRNMLSKRSDAELGAKTGASLTLIEGKNKIEKKVPASMQTFSLDYERRRLKDYSRDLSTEDLEIPAFLRRHIE